jgi:hypothetical protein
MRLLAAAEVPAAPGDRVFRYAPGRALFAALLVLCASAALLVVGWRQRAWLADYVAAVSLSCLLLFRQLVLARLRPSNWLVRMGDDGLHLQLRSYLNHRFPPNALTVVYLPYREIRSAREVRERLEIPETESEPPHTRRVTTQRRRLVELELTVDTEPLARALDEEAARLGPEARRRGIVGSRYKHFPVRLASPERLQIEWGVVPGAPAFLAALGRHIEVSPAAEGRRDFVHLGAASREEQDRRILELAEAGHTIAAIRLARELRGCDLEQARAFVDGLRARTPRGPG